MQEAHEALYELHQDQEQTQAHLAAALAHREQVSPIVNALPSNLPQVQGMLMANIMAPFLFVSGVAVMHSSIQLPTANEALSSINSCRALVKLKRQQHPLPTCA